MEKRAVWNNGADLYACTAPLPDRKKDIGSSNSKSGERCDMDYDRSISQKNLKWRIFVESML